MNKLKTVTLGALFLSLPMVMHGQDASEKYNFRSHGFFQVQGGMQLPFTPGNRGDLMQPNFGVNVGAWFAPALGARLSAEGLKSKVLYGNSYESFNYFSIGVDAMINLSPFFVKGNNPKSNIYVLGGLGLTQRGDQDFTGKRDNDKLMHHFRLGLGYEYKISKLLNVSLEYRFNNADDAFNARTNNKDDWYSSLLLGVAVNFAYAKAPYYTPAEAVRPLSLYEQMQQGVKTRMNTWMRRLKGESADEYQARVNTESMETQRLEFTKAISTDMAGNRISTSVSDLSYNAGAEMLGVSFSDMPSIALKVPRSDVGSFKNASDLQFTNTVYNLNPGDKFEVLYTDVINPATGKKYTYINQRDAQFVDAEGYVPMAAVQQDMINNQRLQQIRTNAIAEVQNENKDYTLDHTTISVNTELLPTASGADYKIRYTYTVQDGFSVHDDFAPGKYEAEKSAASLAMLKIIKQSLQDENIAKYIKEGKALQVSYTGSADAKPINGKIAYNGKYGDIKNLAVKVNGQGQTMTITPATGITSNEQLSLVRATSVSNYIKKNVPELNRMNVTEDYNVEVSSKEGSEFRRVAVDLIFREAF